MQLLTARLRKPRRVLYFLCDNLAIKRGEACIVKTDRGPEWGECVLPPEPCSPEMEKKHTMSVERKATSSDYHTIERIEEDEKEAIKIAVKKIELHKLPMKLVDVEYTFDRRKVVFYFTAEDRVDFRELVRDLAHDLRTRIELRHIQVRDEAKMVGGLGSCGRELCCSSWLNEFMPISMRMAKRQNLSLNPSKISGQCGRLLCCLSYEDDQYGEAKKRKPTKREDPQEAQRPTRKPVKEIGQWEDRPKPEQKEDAGKSAAPSAQGPPVQKAEDNKDDADKSKRRRRPRKRRRKKSGGGSTEGGTTGGGSA